MLSEKKILNETKNHNPPFKLNGRSLSTDLYKLYINPLLDRLQDVGIELRIGNINGNNTGCADDVALLSTQLSDAQIMVNIWLLTLRTSRDMSYNQRKV